MKLLKIKRSKNNIKLLGTRYLENEVTMSIYQPSTQNQEPDYFTLTGDHPKGEKFRHIKLLRYGKQGIN